MSYQLETRKCVYKLVGRMRTTDIVKTLKNHNVSEATIYRAIRDCKKGIPCTIKEKSGRPKTLDDKAIERMIKMAKTSVDMTNRKLAKEFNVSYITVYRLLKKNNVTFFGQKLPEYTKEQLEKIPLMCHNLRIDYLPSDRSIVMDHQKYFNFNECCPNKSFTEPKLFVWCAVSSAGISKPIIGSTNKTTIDSDTYVNHCLPMLSQFIEQHHPKHVVIFWPSLTQFHYSSNTKNWLQSRRINYIPNDVNPPNIPQARPVETFFDILERLVYDDGWIANSEVELRERIGEKFSEVNVDCIKTLMDGVLGKLQSIEMKGPFNVC